MYDFSVIQDFYLEERIYKVGKLIKLRFQGKKDDDDYFPKYISLNQKLL